MGINRMTDTAHQILLDEAKKIKELLSNQQTICLSCPIFEEIRDTRMYGFSEKVDFACKIGVIDEEEGMLLLARLEHDLNKIFEENFQNNTK